MFLVVLVLIIRNSCWARSSSVFRGWVVVVTEMSSLLAQEINVPYHAYLILTALGLNSISTNLFG